MVFIFVSVTWLLFDYDLVKTVFKIYWQRKSLILENDLHTGFAKFFGEFYYVVNLLQYSGTTKHIRISQNLLLFLRKKRERAGLFCIAGLSGQIFTRTVFIKFSFHRDARQPLSNKALGSDLFRLFGRPVYRFWLKLYRPKNIFQVFFFQLYFNKKYFEIVITDLRTDCQGVQF